MGDHGEGIVSFLDTAASKEDLAATLRVLREFKACESMPEWVATPFMCWVKLEQLEEFLDHLVNDAELKSDTVEALKQYREEKE